LGRPPPPPPPPPHPRAGTCPLGRAYDRLSTVRPTITGMTFASATASSHPKLVAQFVPASMDARFQALRSDMNIVVQVMKSAVTGHTFAWRFDTDDYFYPEQSVEAYTGSANAFSLVSTATGPTGVFLYWDPIKGGTLSFNDAAGSAEMASGDTYTFTLSVERTVDSTMPLDTGDSNTLHQLLECSGRGYCDSEQGKCTCLPGFTGEACQRSEWRGEESSTAGGPAQHHHTHLLTHFASISPHTPTLPPCSRVPQPVQQPRQLPNREPLCAGWPGVQCRVQWL
jgi:hypothetical protein